MCAAWLELWVMMRMASVSGPYWADAVAYKVGRYARERMV